MKRQVVLAVFAVVVFQFAFTTDALRCIECGGPHEMDMGCTSSLPAPKECNPGVTHCKKVMQTALSMGTITRSCALPNEHKPEQECVGPSAAQTCMYYCDTDGCNSAPTSFSQGLYWMVLCAGLLLCLFVNKGTF